MGDGYEVAGYCSTYNNEDHVGDVVMPGAFDKALASSTKTLFLYCHDLKQMLGVPLQLKSDTHGLFGRFRISRTPLGETVHTLMEDGAPFGFSIGFFPDEFEYADSGTRLLKQIDLVENTLAPLPIIANPLAQVTAFKTLLGLPDAEAKAVLGEHQCGACAVQVDSSAQDNVATYVTLFADGRQVLQTVVPGDAVDVMDLRETARAAINAPASIPVVRSITKAGNVNRVHSVEVALAGPVTKAQSVASILVTPHEDSRTAGSARGRYLPTVAPGLIDLLPPGSTPTSAEAGAIRTVRLDRKALSALHTCNGYQSHSAFPGEYSRKDVWTGSYVNNLPDAAFAGIQPGGKKDDEGKTVPRTLRHLPHHDSSVKNGSENSSVDLPHLRDALARVEQMQDGGPEFKARCRSHLVAHAKALNVGDYASGGGKTIALPDFDPAELPFDAAWDTVTDLLHKGLAHTKLFYERRREEGREPTERHADVLRSVLRTLEGAQADVKYLLQPDSTPEGSEAKAPVVPDGPTQLQALRERVRRKLARHPDLMPLLEG